MGALWSRRAPLSANPLPPVSVLSSVPIRHPVPAGPALVLAFLLASCLGLLAACQPEAKAEDEQAAGVRARELPRVRVAVVAQREALQLLETTSVLESEHEVQIFPRIAGVVLEIHAEEGSAVQAGEVLATLQDEEQALAVRDANVALEEARHNLERFRLAADEAREQISTAKLAAEQAQRDYARNQQLFEGKEKLNILSASALEASALARDNALAAERRAEISLKKAELEIQAGETAVRRAEVAVEQAELALSYTRISSPFDGVVADRRVRVGDSVGPGACAFVLTDPASLRLIFYRPQEEFGLFSRSGTNGGSPRLQLSATAEALPGSVFPGYIERVSPTIDAASGQFRVTARLASEDVDGNARLLPGMLLRLSIVTARHPNALMVPKRALEREGERRYLLAVEEGRVRKVEVEESFAEDECVEVVPREGSRLAAGDTVIVVGARDLSDGDPVEVDLEQSSASQGGGNASAGSTQDG